MVQLHILSGKKAGAQFTGTRFPIHVGRAAEADISVDEPGVWPRHLKITRRPEGLVCQAEANARVGVNDVQVDQAVLRNGDVISIGALKIQFALAPVRQSSLFAREWLVWTALAVICLGQVALICRLIR
jgi:pSer/pThr/pTyr-binding forkhead associated (FHA) protein